MKKSMLLLLCLPLTAFAGSDVYRCQDEAGKTYYSDKECEGGKKIILPAPQTYTPAPSQRQFNYTPQRTNAALETYDSIQVTAPENDSTIRDNSGNVVVSITILPALRTGLGHKLQLYLDDQPYGEAGTNTSFSLSNLPRGTHSVRPVIMSHSGEVLAEGTPSTFHISRFSILLQKQRNEKKKPPKAP